MSESTQTPVRERRRPWVAVLCFIILGLVFYHAGSRLFEHNRWLQAPFETPPFDRHIDEYAWFHYTYHYDLFFRQHVLDHLAWGHDVPAIGQPNSYKFVLGWLLERNGVELNTDEEQMRLWWQPFTDDDEFKAYLSENLPFSDRALLLGRFFSAVFAYAAIVLCVVYLARWVRLPFAAAGGVFVAHLSLFGVTRMMSDSLLLLCFVVCFLLLDLISGLRWPLVRGPVIVVYSLLVGFTMGVKLTGFLALTYLPAMLLVKWARERSRENLRDGALWSLMHGVIAFGFFVVLHPQTYDNPFVGTVRFFSHQAPVTLDGGLSLIVRAKGELVFQIGQLARNLGELLFLPGLTGVWFVAIVLLLAMGFVGFVLGVDRSDRLQRATPLLITIGACVVALSHELDERYTWLLTVVLSYFVVMGAAFFFDNLTILLTRPARSGSVERTTEG